MPWRSLVLLGGMALRCTFAGAQPAAPTTTPPVAAERAHGLVRLGALRALKQDWRGAETAYREATQAAPTEAAAWSGLAYVLAMQERPAEAVAPYEESLRLRPDHPETLEHFGRLLVRLGRRDDARAVLDLLRPLDGRRAATLAHVLASDDAP